MDQPTFNPTLTFPAAMDTPGVRSANAQILSLALMDARNHSLALLTAWEQTAAKAKWPPPVACNDPWWVAGRIGWFAEFWTGRNPQRGLGVACPGDASRLASIEPQADAWWAQGVKPDAAKTNATLPDAPTVRAYLLETLEATLELLDSERDVPEALYFFQLALFHEDWQRERLMVQAQTLGLPLKVQLPGGMRHSEPLLLPAGRWQLGSMPAQGFCPDNELAAHTLSVPEFEIDAQPVSWSQYLEFVDDGGYDRAELWNPQGWAWLQAQEMEQEHGGGRRAPRHVEQISMASGAVLQTRFGAGARMAGNQAVMHVTWWEADAWCRWAGRRLPDELEWEVAACQASRRGFAWGDVWEWTAGKFYAYPGFVRGPWARYSAPHFGNTRVLRGASFATHPRLKTPKFRGFAAPGYDAGFVGFRSCAD